jgi:hypothetical protein
VFQAAENLFGTGYTHIPYEKMILTFMRSYAVANSYAAIAILQLSENGDVLIGRKDV